MDNPFLASTDPPKGSMFLGVLGAPEASVSYLRGWKRTQWWDGPLTFWDDFTDDGALTSDSPAVSPVGSIAVTQTLPAGGESTVTFLLAWHFPNRTPDRCGWPAPENEQKTVVVGNYYCQRFTDAWEVARQVAQQLPSLEERSRSFAAVVESSTLPPTASRGATINRDAATGLVPTYGTTSRRRPLSSLRWLILSANLNSCATRAKTA
jgi:uncharacterized protein (DUF608 family)